MKRLFIFSLIALTIVSCRKKSDDDDTTTSNTFESRIQGIWDLTAVDYSFELPSIIPGSPPTQIDGSAVNVDGTFDINHDPNTISYNYTFDVSINGFGSQAVTANENGSWTLSSDGSIIFVQLSDGSVNQYEIIEDLANKQVYKTTVTENVAIIGDIDILTTITLTK